MRLVVGGRTLIVSVGAYFSYQVVRDLTLENFNRNAFLEVQPKPIFFLFIADKIWCL
ncbi:hypothetical protein QUA70_04680 [Microcoleus sp. LAD1_D5]|uniref:hypothetical protein n=1 Tax=unclassified Microcoleus TaxID=2642155 RepID=UPI002FD05E0D